MRRVKGYKALSEAQRDLFERVYTRQLNVWGNEMKKRYAPEQLKEIKWDPKDGCLKVYFKNGDWWHYCIDGTWF